MTPQEHIDYLRLAFQTVGLGFNKEQIETIILTTKAFNRKKARFSIMDAAKIRAEINTKYPPVAEPAWFDELEQMIADGE